MSIIWQNYFSKIRKMSEILNTKKEQIFPNLSHFFLLENGQNFVGK